MFSRLTLVTLVLFAGASSAAASIDDESLSQTLSYCDEARSRDPRCMTDLLTVLKETIGQSQGEEFWQTCMQDSGYDADSCVLKMASEIRRLKSIKEPRLICVQGGASVKLGSYISTSEQTYIVRQFSDGEVRLEVFVNLTQQDRDSVARERERGILGGALVAGRFLGRDFYQLQKPFRSDEHFGLSAGGISLVCSYGQF